MEQDLASALQDAEDEACRLSASCFNKSHCEYEGVEHATEVFACFSSLKIEAELL